MKHSRLTAVTALLVLSAVLFISCVSQTGDEPGNTINTTGADTEPVVTSALSTVEVNDYDGYVFSIVVTNQDKRHVDFVAEEETGATLNDLVYRRNMRVEDTYNITLASEDKDYGMINSTVQKDVAAGESSYSLYVSNATAYTLASAGNLIAFNNMPGINIENPWWDQNAIAGMSIGGNIYMLTGDISPTGLLTSECILFNKKLFADKNIAYPYDIAFDGGWTMDVMYDIGKGLTEDVNGDGKISDKDDLFSFTCWFDNAHAFFYGAGGVMVNKDEEDIPFLDWDIERYSSIYEKLYNIVIVNEANYSTSDHEYSFKVFNEGRAYFCGITFQKIEMFLRDMNDDYGVLPMPKYDESQERYMTDVSGAGSMIIMPVSAADTEIVGNITEALAAAAYDMITPSLYDIIASTKNVRDEESARMVQLIIRNRVFDMAHMYYIPGDDFCYDLLKAKSTDVASYFAGKEAAANSTLDKLVTAFLENN
ncbi:MAG: ABC transporter substrate-binding protein [Eubacteriales bacterium]|jgi:hypothetical protein|nr:ABC transporter substrate-binding protein [Eubacteriales bacterium]